MEIKEYISSGILEAYVLGSLSAQEIAEVESMSANHPEVKKEIKAIEDALFHYAQKFSKEPASSLRSTIFKSIDNGGKRVPKIIKPEVVKQEIKIAKEEKVENKEEPIILTTGKSKSVRSSNIYIIAASFVVIVVCALTAFNYWHKWKMAEEKIIALQKETMVNAEIFNKAKFALEEKIKLNNSQLSSVERELQMLLDTNMKTVILKGMPISPESSALVFWKKDSKEVFIDVKNLPAPPTDMQYQLWALENGVMIDAGIFEIPETLQFQKLKIIQEAKAFAVTLEKRGGSETPSSEAIYAMGYL